MEALTQELRGDLRQFIYDTNTANAVTHASIAKTLEEFKNSLKVEIGPLVEAKMDQFQAQLSSFRAELQKRTDGIPVAVVEADTKEHKKVCSREQFEEMETKLSSRTQDATVYQQKLVSFFLH